MYHSQLSNIYAKVMYDGQELKIGLRKSKRGVSVLYSMVWT